MSKMFVDVRRCIGCHACSVACKTEHSVPLGAFRTRVRWLPEPGDGRMTFLPLFGSECDLGANRAAHGLAPACVTACPTKALELVDEAPADAVPLERKGDTRDGVVYRGHARWQEDAMNAGVALSPEDPDPIYEQW